MKNKFRFDRNELSGAFGDIGTDLPLLIGLIIICGLNPLNVFLTFGSLQIISGLIYGIPVPLQPLKAVAAVSIAMGLSPEMVTQSGLILGILMLFLTLTGCIEFIANVVPSSVVRGIQFGLGIKLSMLAFNVYIPSYETAGIILAIFCIILILLFSKNTNFLSVLIVLVAGTFFGLYQYSRTGFIPDVLNHNLTGQIHTQLSILNLISLIVLPQIALSVGNSILATKKLVNDYFPGLSVTERKISFTYSIFNIIIPFLGGVPACHGSGGLAGHYRFGARTGGSLIIYGLLLITLGLLFHNRVDMIYIILPLPVLGIILLFEGIALGKLIKKTDGCFELCLALITGFACVFLSYGFISGLVFGTCFYYIYKYLISRYQINVEN